MSPGPRRTARNGPATVAGEADFHKNCDSSEGPKQSGQGGSTHIHGTFRTETSHGFSFPPHGSALPRDGSGQGWAPICDTWWQKRAPTGALRRSHGGKRLNVRTIKNKPRFARPKHCGNGADCGGLKNPLSALRGGAWLTSRPPCGRRRCRHPGPGRGWRRRRERGAAGGRRRCRRSRRRRRRASGPRCPPRSR